MSREWKWFKQRYYRNINNLSFCRTVLLSGHFQSERVAVGEDFKQQYYRNINIISLCTPVLLSGNIQSEHVAVGDSLNTTTLSDH